MFDSLDIFREVRFYQHVADGIRTIVQPLRSGYYNQGYNKALKCHRIQY
jgi:hypothetical protein